VLTLYFTSFLKKETFSVASKKGEVLFLGLLDRLLFVNQTEKEQKLKLALHCEIQKKLE